MISTIFKVKMWRHKHTLCNVFSLVVSIMLTSLIEVSSDESLGVFCNKTEYIETSSLTCQMCPVNVSMVASEDGLSCVCEDHAVPAGISRCKPCGATELVSVDGASCVPRKCQSAGTGRVVCRKCPSDHISVTQNFEGSSMREVLCVKCARGFKARGNTCERCATCACARGEVAVAGACLPKRFVSDRPKGEENGMHPSVLSAVVKNEYLCTRGDVLACRTLADTCVRNFYNPALAGPCRLWVQPKIDPPKGLPKLVIEPMADDMNAGEFILRRGQDTVKLALAVYKKGGLQILKSQKEQFNFCSLPVDIKVGSDFSNVCTENITRLFVLYNDSSFSPYLNIDGKLKPLPVTVRKPGEYYVKRGTWSSGNFRRYFVVDTSLSPANVTTTVYLQTLLVKVSIERDKQQASSLRVSVKVEVQYGTKTALSSVVTSLLRVEHDMPSAGVTRGLEIFGGVFCTLLTLYAAVLWRGALRRGGEHFSLLPLLAGCIGDALYFSVWFSTLHALAAEAGSLGMTLPLSRPEEHLIKALVYSTVALKAIKVAWVNWKQCSCDIFFLDWSEYNISVKDLSLNNYNDWRLTTLAREWSRVQTERRAPPSYTVTLGLLILHLMTPWQSYLPASQGYRWALASISWWCSYITVLVCRWGVGRFAGNPATSIPRVCRGTGLSLLVFQEEYYAHYVDGRNDDSKDLRMMAGPLAMCRIVMAPQLRMVYSQLSTLGLDDMGDSMAKRALLSKLLAAFFERALDGLNWVGSERSVLERLLNVELSDRESGSTSVLLYDPGDRAPSCLALTWWGEEWTLGTFDAMLFGCVVLATHEPLQAALVTVAVWQIMKHLRQWFGDRNQKLKTNVNLLRD